MRLICGVAGVVAAASFAAAAWAIDIPMPPVPTVAPVPTVVVPTVPTPSLPSLPSPPPSPPPVTAPPNAPPQTVPVVPVVPAVPAPAPKGGAGAPAAPAAASAAPAPASAPPATAPAAAPAITPARPRSGSPPRSSLRAAAGVRPKPVFRPVVARFRVPHATRVRIVVREVAPLCRRIGAYSLAARRGANTVRLPKRVGKHRLGAGTYVLIGRSRGERIFKARARIVRGRTLVLDRSGAVSRCEGARATAAAAYVTSAPQSSAPATEHQGVKGRSASGTPQLLRPELPGPSGQRSPVVRAISLDYAPDPLRPLLVALAAAAIALLAVAALPQRVLPAGPAAAFVAQRRGYIVATGIWLLAIVAVVTTFA